MNTAERNERKKSTITLDEAFSRLPNLSKKQFRDLYEPRNKLYVNEGGEPVYVSLDKKNKKVVDLRFINIAGFFSFLISIDWVLKNSIRRALSEYYILKELNHPNIIKYHSIFTLDGEYFKRAYLVISMDHINGNSLLKLNKDGIIFRGPVFLNLAAQILDAFLYLKRRKINYSNANLENIIISDDYSRIYIIGYEYFCYNDRWDRNEDFLHCITDLNSYFTEKDMEKLISSLFYMWLGYLPPEFEFINGGNLKNISIVPKKGQIVIGEESPKETGKIKYILGNTGDYNLEEMVLYARSP